MEELISPTCEQANALIAFLYGELNKDESRAFHGHLNACRSCSEELAAFRYIRSSVVALRDESLGTAAAVVMPSAAARAAHQSHRSALTAFREFFVLSPAWLKGAVAFATILFCLFAGLAIVRLRSQDPAPMANNPASSNSTAYSDQQLNALVERRVQDELLRIKNSRDQPAVAQAATQHSTGSVAPKSGARRASQVGTDSPARRPLSKVEREQLAADLRLVAANNDNELELLDDQINQ